MIEKFEELQLAVRVRQLILDLIAGVKDTGGLVIYDHSPNWLTQNRVRAAANEFEHGLLQLGSLLIEAHAPCGASHHSSKVNLVGQSRDYWCVGLQGKPEVALERISDGSGVFRFNGHVYQTDFGSLTATQVVSRAPCPCRPGVQSAEHSLCRYFAWRADLPSRIPDLATIHQEISEAARLATEKRRRSTIREQLLIALIEIERLIVTETAAEHATRRLMAAD